jgi:integrase
MPKKRGNRLYTREQGGERRYYGDFRDYRDVGGGREALIPRGAERATTDEKLAQALVTARLADLEDRRRRGQRGQPVEDIDFATYVVHHLRLKRKAGSVEAQWLEAAAGHLEAAICYFCNAGRELDRDAATGEAKLAGVKRRALDDITVSDIQGFVAWLGQTPNGRGGTLSSSSQRKYLNSLSNLYRRAISEGRVPPNYNPAVALMEKPQDSSGRTEARWLEVHEAALLLESARTYVPRRAYLALPPGRFHALLATMLLTGGRPSEVLGLEVGDISFERQTVTFRPNSHRRRLKTAMSTRSVRLWPQLEGILSDYLRSERRLAGLLFPNVDDGGMIVDIRKCLDMVAERAGWKRGEIRPYAFRHTYCAARLQTLDGGAPVSPFTVGKELGHGGMSLVNRVYGHLGSVRHRSEVVEFRVDQHIAHISEKLSLLAG